MVALRHKTLIARHSNPRRTASQLQFRFRIRNSFGIPLWKQQHFRETHSGGLGGPFQRFDVSGNLMPEIQKTPRGSDKGSRFGGSFFFAPAPECSVKHLYNSAVFGPCCVRQSGVVHFDWRSGLAI
jgi:hypothetical protein